VPVPLGPVSRRATLGLGAAGLVAVGGCDAGDDAARPSLLGSGSPTATADVDPDSTLVDQVVAHLVAAEQLAAAGRRPDLVALHRAHLDALEADQPAPGRPARRRTPAEVRRGEVLLQRRLDDAALAAESGALARLLASMAAAVAQRLAAMPAARSGAGPDGGAA
jgi:hypothetical protein